MAVVDAATDVVVDGPDPPGVPVGAWNLTPNPALKTLLNFLPRSDTQYSSNARVRKLPGISRQVALPLKLRLMGRTSSTYAPQVTLATPDP